MKRSLLVFSASFLGVAASIASQYPPDYDYDEEWVDAPPSGLSAKWAADDVYVSWDKPEDIYGDDVDGYRLYRAADEDSAYVLLNTTDSIDNDDDGLTDEQYEHIPTTCYVDTASELSAAGIYETIPFYYMVTAIVLIWDTAEDIYSCYESDYSEPVEVVEDIYYTTGCFIATAAFGSRLADEVKILCSFRDEVLVQSGIGRRFVNFYYRVSPPVADFIRGRPILRCLIRLHLKPIIMLMKEVDSAKLSVDKESFVS